MTRFAVPALAACLLAPAARADQLTLGTSSPPASPITMDAGTVSMPVNITVSNNTGMDLPANLMTAWQLNLTIVPDPGTTGSLTFSTPATGSVPNPPNYVFGANGVGIAATNTATALGANDISTLTGGVQVPVAATNLLQTTFAATPTTLGTFGVFARQGAGNTIWTDAATPPQTRFFVNVPTGTGQVRIATITVVPEPASCTLLAVAGLGAWAAGRRRRRKEHQPDAPARAARAPERDVQASLARRVGVRLSR
jgi:hypothetical protein